MNKPVAVVDHRQQNGVTWLKIKKGRAVMPDHNILLYTHPAKTLTDAVVNELWAESQEDGIAMQQGFTTQQHYFAYLILRKASEK